MNSKNEYIKYAKPGENIQMRLQGIVDDSLIQKGDCICTRESLMPASDLFEAEIDILQLLEYKPILSKGYQCMMHIHTCAEEAVIKDIMVSYEKNEKGEVLEKQKPQFTKSFCRIIARVSTRIPICLEKFETIPQMGRFTLRDEGRTIALGKIQKYRPAKIVEFKYEQKAEEEEKKNK